MKRKIYFIIYSILQFIMGIVVFINNEKYAKTLYDATQSMLTDIPNSSKMFTMSTSINVILFSAGICTTFAIIFLIITLLNKVADRKKFAIFLTLSSLLLCNDDITTIASLIALILVIGMKGNKKEKVEKKKLEKLDDLKITFKDILLAIALILVYSSQFIIGNLSISKLPYIIIGIAYYVIVFCLSIFVFRKRLIRDFKETRKDFGAYFKYIFRMWGIMISLSLLAACIRILFGVDGESANQISLNNAPLWYVIPLSVIWAPIVEESVFRGAIRRFISNDKAFIIVSAISFGLIHTLGQEVGFFNTLFQSLQYIVMGGVIAYTYTKTNNIYTNMGLHCIQNIFASLMMLLVL